MKRFLLSILLLALPALAVGQSATPVASIKFDTAAGKIIGGATSMSIRDNADSNDNFICLDAGTCTVRGAVTITSGNITLTNGSIVFSTAGTNSQLAAYVPTLAATPVVGTNMILPGLNVIPTAAANAAAILGPSTPVPGQQFRIVNSGPNSVRIKAGGGATLNGATAGGYIVLVTLAAVDCFTTSVTNHECLQPVIPTPAGP